MSGDERLPILVVDDEEVVRTTLRAVLESEGYGVVTVGNAEEGLKALDGGPFLMVITDIMMPGMNGLEFQKHVRQRLPELPVVIITAFPTIDRAVEALRNGAANFITKPFDIGQVLQAVERASTARRVTERNLATQATVTSRVQMTIPSTVQHVMGAVHFLTERTLLADYYPRDAVFQIRLALDEALTNALEHGNKFDASRHIAVDAQIDAEQFKIWVQDEGPGFDPDAVANCLDETNLQALLDGGRGVFLMRCHMDGVEYNETGNRVCMWRRHPSAPLRQEGLQESENPAAAQGAR